MKKDDIIESRIRSHFHGKSIVAIQMSSVQKFFASDPEAEEYVARILEDEPLYEKTLYVVHHILFGMDLAKCSTCGKLLPWHQRKNQFCSKKCIMLNDVIIEKRKTTNREKYGSDFYYQSDRFKELRKNSMLKRYGVDDPLKADEVKAQMRKTNLEKYGVEYYSQTKDFIDKRKKTWLEKYGSDVPTSCKEVQEKRDKTSLEKYGSKNAMTAYRWKTIQSWSDYIIPLFTQKDLSSDPEKIYQWRCTKCGKIFEQKIYNTNHLLEVGEQVPRCLDCYPLLRECSKKEKEVLNFVKENYSGIILENDRKEIHPYELDIFIPDLKIAIEFDGTYWHQEGVTKPIGYHDRKDQMCHNRGITIYHIKESDWDRNKDEVKDVIKKLLSDLN